MSRAQGVVSVHPPARILKVYLGALTGFCHLCCSDDLILLFQGCILENVSPCGNFPRSGKEMKNLQFPGSCSGVNRWSCPLSDLLQPEVSTYWLFIFAPRVGCKDSYNFYCPCLMRISLNTIVISGRKASTIIPGASILI